MIRHIQGFVDGAYEIWSRFAMLLIGVAYASETPAPVERTAAFFNVHPETLFAAFLGGIIFVILTEGTIGQRVRRAGAGFILAFLASDKTLEWLRWEGAASERIVALFYSLIGVILLEAVLRRLARRADAVADGAIDFATARVGITVEKSGGTDATKA